MMYSSAAQAAALIKKSASSTAKLTKMPGNTTKNHIPIVKKIEPKMFRVGYLAANKRSNKKGHPKAPFFSAPLLYGQVAATFTANVIVFAPSLMSINVAPGMVVAGTVGGTVTGLVFVIV